MRLISNQEFTIGTIADNHLINLYFLKFVFKNTLSFRFICIHRVKREITPTTYRAFVWSSVSLNTNSIKYPNSNIRKIIRNIPITIIPRNNCFNLILINASTILFFFFFACPLTTEAMGIWRFAGAFAVVERQGECGSKTR